MHIGGTPMRFGNSTSRILRGVNSLVVCIDDKKNMISLEKVEKMIKNFMEHLILGMSRLKNRRIHCRMIRSHEY